MSISYGASPGTIVTEFAADETLGSQSQQTGNNTVVVSNTISTAPPGNGQIGTKFPSYVGRLCIINIAGTPQVRMVTAEVAGTTTTRILTVNENWATNPVSGDTIHVFYDVDDIETGGVSGGINLNVRTGLYELTNKLTIGDGSLRTGLQINTAIGLESNDGGATLSHIVKNLGYFYMGYAQAGTPLAGAINTFVNNAVNEPSWQWQSGAKGKIYDSLLWSQLNYSLFYECAVGSAVEFVNSKLIKLSYASTFFGATLTNTSISGNAAAAELIRLSSTTTVNGLVLVKTGGLATASADTTIETVTARGVVFVGNYYLISVNSNKTWKLINPVWQATTYTDFNWLTSTANYVYDQRSIDAIVQTADGTKIQNANVIVYENTVLADLVLETYTTALGVAAGVFTYKLHSTNSSTVTYGGHALRVDGWLYFPFIQAQVSTDYFNGTVVLAPDPAISQTNQATALSDGSTVTWNQDANASSIIAYTGGSGTLAVGSTVTQATSGATGVVTQIADGNSTAGTVHLKSRNGTAFASTYGLSASGWSATYTAASEKRYSIWIDGKTLSMQVVHDYLAALTAQTTLSATGELIHEWGKQYQARALYKGSAGFYTGRSGTLGVFVTNFGAGTIAYFTDDAGGTWVPPTSVTLSVTVKDATTGAAVSGATVFLRKVVGDAYVLDAVTGGSGVVTAPYAYVGSEAIYGRVVKGTSSPLYQPAPLSGTIESSGFSQTSFLIRDE